MADFTFTREEALREAAALVAKVARASIEGPVLAADVQAHLQVAQVWATIGAGMQPGESLTVVDHRG